MMVLSKTYLNLRIKDFFKVETTGNKNTKNFIRSQSLKFKLAAEVLIADGQLAALVDGDGRSNKTQLN